MATCSFVCTTVAHTGVAMHPISDVTACNISKHEMLIHGQTPSVPGMQINSVSWAQILNGSKTPYASSPAGHTPTFSKNFKYGSQREAFLKA